VGQIKKRMVERLFFMKVIGFYVFTRVIFGANVAFAPVFAFHRTVGVMNNKPFLAIRGPSAAALLAHLYNNPCKRFTHY
jgi:hypothetical protein